MKNFDAIKIKNNIIQWIRNWFESNGKDCNAVIGISSGKDSTVVAALCCEALGRDRVISVKMPCGEQYDIDDSNKVINFLGIKSFEINIKDSVDGVTSQLKKNNILITDQAICNLPARIRMSTLFAVAQCCNGRVSCNCNLSEDYVGYSTFGGDDFGSFAPLRNLTTDEVMAIGDALGLPYELVHKAPADGLCGKTDEDNLGFTYATLNKYIRTGKCDDEAVRARIDELHRKNLFKLQPMPSFPYNSESLIDELLN
jgi:NAD+ synthase